MSSDTSYRRLTEVLMQTLDTLAADPSVDPLAFIQFKHILLQWLTSLQVAAEDDNQTYPTA